MFSTLYQISRQWGMQYKHAEINNFEVILGQWRGKGSNSICYILIINLNNKIK